MLDRIKDILESIWDFMEDAFPIAMGVVGLLLMLSIVPLWMMVESILGCWLWNRILPKLFGFPTITYWQFFGLDIICSMLVGNPFWKIDLNELFKGR